jgi:hypothetical protein
MVGKTIKMENKCEEVTKEVRILGKSKQLSAVYF